MSQALFSTEGSVWRTAPYTADDQDDEELVDQSLPSSPLHRTFGRDPFEAGSSSSRRTSVESLLHHDLGQEIRLDDQEVKPEVDHDETPLAETGEDDLDEPELEPEDEKQCRICFSGIEEEPALGRLISPCLCTGSVRYVHVSCINAWRGTGSNTKAFIECQQCHYHYHFRRTLVSGLATSAPILLLSTLVLFLSLTLFAGQIVTWLLSIPAFHNRILEPPSSKLVFLGDDDEWYDLDDTVLYVSSGGTLIWDIVVGAVRVFAAVANKLSQSRSGVLSRLPLWVQWTGVRFLLGMAVLGSFSFLSLLISLSLFGPLQLANGLRGVGFLGNWTRRRRNTGTGVGQYMMIAIVLIGSINTLISVYHTVEGITERILKYVETQILEVNPEDMRKARERKEEVWWKRWLKEKRYATRLGWHELWYRLVIRLKNEIRGVKGRFTRWKTAWALGIDEAALDELDERI